MKKQTLFNKVKQALNFKERAYAKAYAREEQDLLNEKYNL